MNNELKPYGQYKNAPLPWVDKLPSHWEIKRAKAMFYKVNRPVRDFDEVVTCFRDGTVTLRKNRRTTGFTESIKEIGYQGIRKGDLVIHVMDAFAGAVGVSDSDGKATPVYSVCIPKGDLNNYYYAYIVREMAKTGFIQSLYRGIRERSSDFRFEVFANQYLPVPSLEEQDQIVKFLDSQLAKINKLIFAKRRQIALLKEKIDTMTNRAIMVDGINKQRLVNISKQIGDWINRKDDQEYIPIGLLNRGRGIFHKSPILGSDLGDSEFYQVEDNALIFSGQFAWEGAVALTEEKDKKCISSHRYYMIRGIEGVAKNEYLWAFFCTKYGDLLLNLNSRGAAGRNRPLNMSSLLKEHIPLPPMLIQEEISKEVNILLRFVKEVNRLENFILEYRTRLISDVVTGKVDVRDLEITQTIENDTFYLEEELDDNEEVVDSEECEV